jgi:hypothetical protein
MGYIWRLVLRLVESLGRIWAGAELQKSHTPAPQPSVFVQPKVRDNKSWFYKLDVHQFIAFVNQYGSCSITRFDAQTGKPIGRVETIQGKDWQQAFRETYEHAQRVFVPFQPSLVQARKYGLPHEILSSLQSAATCSEPRQDKLVSGVQFPG